MKVLEKSLPGAPSFKYKEFIRSNTATRKGIKNIPGPQEWKNLEALAKNVLQPLRNAIGPLKINSGYRSPELNIAIGGSATSNHCRGEASDIEPAKGQVTLVAVIEWLIDNVEFRTVILEYPPDGWVHVDYRKGGNTKKIKLKDKTHNYSVVTLEEIKKLYPKL